MKLVKFLIVFTFFFSFVGCDNDEPTATLGSITVNLNQYWNEGIVTSRDFNTATYTNANDDILTINKLRYLISNITLHKTDGSNEKIMDYYLVDLAGLNPHNSFTISDVAIDTYSSISFTFGFNEADNIDGNYLDLNSA